MIDFELEIIVSSTCNLNCRYCDHFSSVLEPYFLSQKEIIRYCEILKNKNMIPKSFILMGGEPLLNENISCICEKIYHYFPNIKINIITNGILLNEDVLSKIDKRVNFSITPYPININYDSLKKKEKREGQISFLSSRFTFGMYTFDKNSQDNSDILEASISHIKIPKFDQVEQKAVIKKLNDLVREYIASSKTEIDNIFINDYLPFAQPQFVVVYIYGLYICSSTSFDNSLENFAKTLNMSEEDVIGAFEFWEEQGLVRILKTNPIQVTYIPLKNVLTANKLYKPDKYEVFNQQASDIFIGKRCISKHEYEEYYDFLERYHVEQEALLMIMKYCVETKKSAVGYNYILTVARNWASEGITTASQVEEKLKAFEDKNPELSEIFNAMGIKRAPYVEERSQDFLLKK